MGLQNTILVKGNNPVDEAIASGVVTPGNLIERISTGAVRRHATAGGNVAALVAKEDDLQGNGITDNYADEERVFFYAPQPGDVLNMLLKNGETAVIGSFLESDGAGKLQVHVPDQADVGLDSASDTTTLYSAQIKFQAIEAVDMSGSSGADPNDGRILVEVV
ncbi:hypothetical protein LCGC14_0717540 [marine sediment metagenome]|uniref:Uncharacterized protein n=1 Tax=marine sediment metagenome TaxID=412755 RepID=A0A0F9QHL0_9ZZZZ